MTQIYISSSWKNRVRVREIAELLRLHGYDVYDFTDPRCRKSPEIPPEKFPDAFDPARHDYANYLNAVPEWRSAVETNRQAILDADICILLLPCGADSHADWGVAVGVNKRTVVMGHPKAGERTPSHMWAEAMIPDDNGALIDWIKRRGAYA